MNKGFAKKIIRAKILEYEALKEIMPSSIKNKIDDIEKEAINLFKEVAIELLQDEGNIEKENRKSVKKIGVDFN
ncbi:hypothetical protein [Clostridium sp. LP20]|uniref:hypothetical protein n=1 Tax=Clostridium sp. LP20 TaxID=3418665 RepID=UPI003EE4C339